MLAYRPLLVSLLSASKIVTELGPLSVFEYHDVYMIAYLHILKVLILAGGAQPSQNFNSHKVHVDRLVKAAHAKGVSADDIVG